MESIQEVTNNRFEHFQNIKNYYTFFPFCQNLIQINSHFDRNLTPNIKKAKFSKVPTWTMLCVSPLICHNHSSFRSHFITLIPSTAAAATAFIHIFCCCWIKLSKIILNSNNNKKILYSKKIKYKKEKLEWNETDKIHQQQRQYNMCVLCILCCS